jgi:hypothetical protein
MAMVTGFEKWEMDIVRLNYATIILIPKQAEATTLKKFRPISLIDYSFKIFSKAMNNRLKALCDRLLAPNQTAFVKGRYILESVVSAQEIIHDAVKSGRPPSPATADLLCHSCHRRIPLPLLPMLNPCKRLTGARSHNSIRGPLAGTSLFLPSALWELPARGQLHARGGVAPTSACPAYVLKARKRLEFIKHLIDRLFVAL